MQDYLEKYKEIFTPSELEAIYENDEKEKNVTFRVNPLISTPEEIEEALKKADIEFMSGPMRGSYILPKKYNERTLWDLGIYKSGRIYLQTLSSQLPVYFFDNIGSDDEDLKILDATAAPGGKTSQLSALFPNSEIYAFERSKVRYEKMIYNLGKLKVNNVKRIHNDVLNIGTHVSELEFFDKILLDVPCSSEGKIHTNKAINPETIGNKKYYNIQKNIVDAVIPYLKSGGEIIYSTCTINPLENEGILHYIISKYKDLEIVELESDYIDSDFFKQTKTGVTEYKKYKFHPSVQKSLRVLPSENADGFFIAKIIKK